MKVSSALKASVLRGVGVYIFDGQGRVLLTQRGPEARHEPFAWEGPGGAAEDGETFETAAAREILEELGIHITLDGILGHFESVTDSNGQRWEAVIFKAHTTEQPVIQEPGKCVGFGWFRADEARRLNLASYTVKDFQHLGWL